MTAKRAGAGSHAWTGSVEGKDERDERMDYGAGALRPEHQDIERRGRG